ncbi:unnamed protein product [Bursaphelenchus okinawaensis]|uniref:Peptidyl-prolyl cis-trans isomerase n=1 Tax=Bursaphelenchus okinawaensis TaxID=465554 RepID=A0A811JW69_9BILA|nr:unnamed protein product [Bursaphelenchus okinawaensis]CAG9085154.1 unnamed protein product [Bursaphelenchus okinawaensis]
MSVLLETTLGDIVVDLFYEERVEACQNFLKLCKMKYYNLNQIFTIQKDFIAQTGDPTNTGNGGDSVYSFVLDKKCRYFPDNSMIKMDHRHKGTVSFVNCGQDMFGSQFLFTLDDNLDYLDGKHLVFGQVAEGLEILDILNEEHTNDNHEPLKDIRISHTIILNDPFADPPNLPIPSRSPSPSNELIELSDKICLDQDVEEDENCTEEERQKKNEERELRANAQVLEMIGDLRDIDEKPPDNVLFVCKLNPVTTDSDLEVIFSRFGEIKCCEIIRERRTGKSLQYAFVEFETAEQCEAAYLKMDNVLIDDRRIHVDFSQSVAKTHVWKKKEDEEEEKKKKDKENREKDKDRKRRRSRSPARRSRSPTRRSRTRSPPRHRRRPSPRTRSPPRGTRARSPVQNSRTRSPTRRSRTRSPPRHGRGLQSRTARSPPRQRRRRRSSSSERSRFSRDNYHNRHNRR